MDRNKTVSIATSILISGHIALQDIILLLDSYCIEKGKERKKGLALGSAEGEGVMMTVLKIKKKRRLAYATPVCCCCRRVVSGACAACARCMA